MASRTEILRDCVESNILKAVAGQKLLPAIKVMTDWLRLNGELLLTCVEVCRLNLSFLLSHFEPCQAVNFDAMKVKKVRSC